MLTCDRDLTNTLRRLKDKSSQAAAIAAALGTNRTVRAWFDADPTALHPALTGTEFLNIQMNGSLTFNSGLIVGLGYTYNTTKFTAGINLPSGSAVLRIEGGGHFLQGTLGVGTGFDFNLPENPDPTKGLAFSNTSTVGSYPYLPSGVGPNAPPKIATSPHTIKLYDWRDRKSPVLVGSSSFVNRINDYSLEDPDMARNHGDSALYQTEDIFWEDFSFGGTLVIASQQNTEVGNTPLYQVVVGLKYEGSWRTYPQSNTMIREAVVCAPPAYKVTLEDQNGNLLYTWEMHDGKAINDPRIRAGDLNRGGRSPTAPLQPKFDTTRMLIWYNTLPKITDIAKKIYPGLRNYRDSMSKGQASVISVEPLITGGYGGNSLNGLGDFWYATKWPSAYIPNTLTDPYLDPHMNALGSSAMYSGWCEGWGYEPGAYGTHNWYTSPGGPRHDRAAIASPMAMFLTYPNGNRLEDNVPWREFIDNFYRNSFNHGNHWLTSASKLTTIPIDEVINDVWGLLGTYYGSYGRDKAIQMNGDQRDGTQPSHYDIDGNMLFSGWARDPLHDYHNRGWAALVFRSPIHSICSRFDTVSSMMLHQYPYGNPRDYYMVRTQAWHWLHLVIAWKNGSKHPLGISQKQIEDHFAKILDALYSYIYKPVFIDLEDTGYGRCMRNFGTGTALNNGKWSDNGGRLGFYMGHVLQLMKQTGFWFRMCNRDPKYDTVLKNLIRNMDTYCFGNIVDAKGQGDAYMSYGNNSDMTTIPASWADWYQYRLTLTDTFDDDFIYKAGYNNGVWTHRLYNANPDVSWNQFEQYARMRRDYFPEITHPLLQAANDEFDKYEAIVTGKVNAATIPADKRNVDYFYRYPGVSPFMGPAPGDLVTSY